MIVVDGVKYLRIGEVAKLIGKSALTIKHWYEWMDTKPDTTQKLPPIYRFECDKRNTRFFKETDVKHLRKFIDNMVRGEMSEYNATLWGERGKLILERGTQKLNLK